MSLCGKRRTDLVKAVITVVLLFVAAGAQMHPKRPRQSPQHSKEFSSLPELMREGVHQQFTALSYKIWHDAPLNDQKFDSIAKSADKLHHLSLRITDFKSSYFASGSEDDLKLVDSKASALSDLAQSLANAARSRDATTVDTLLTQIETTCNSCHARFRKELSTQYVEQTHSKN